MNKIYLGSDFARALAKYFNLPSEKTSVDVGLNAGNNEIFSADIKIFLTADDLISIGQILKEMKEVQ